MPYTTDGRTDRSDTVAYGVASSRLINKAVYTAYLFLIAALPHAAPSKLHGSITFWIPEEAKLAGRVAPHPVMPG